MKTSFNMMTDEELSRLAEQAILQEAKRGAVRAEISGPSGWLKNKLPSTNKKFLHNTLLGALASNRVRDKKERDQSEFGKRKRALEEKERNTYKKVYIQASTKSKDKPLKLLNDSGEESKTKQDDTKNHVTWSESGLEFCNSVRTNDNKEKYQNDKSKKLKSVLPRNIKFVGSKNSLGNESHDKG